MGKLARGRPVTQARESQGGTGDMWCWFGLGTVTRTDEKFRREDRKDER